MPSNESSSLRSLDKEINCFECGHYYGNHGFETNDWCEDCERDNGSICKLSRIDIINKHIKKSRQDVLKECYGCGGNTVNIVICVNCRAKNKEIAGKGRVQNSEGLDTEVRIVSRDAPAPRHNYKPYTLLECQKGSLNHSWKHGDQSINAICQKCKRTRRELKELKSDD